MDDNSAQILTKLFNHINSNGACNPRDCGIDSHHNLVFGRQVEPVEKKRLMTAIRGHPALSDLVERRTKISPRDIVSFIAPVAQSAARSQVARRAASRAEFSKPSTAKSSGGVKLALFPKGLLDFAKETNRQQQAYSLVSSVGFGDSLTSGVAKAVAAMAGSKYSRVTSTNLLAPGQCFTYRCSGRSKLASPDLNLCQNIFNVNVPDSEEQHYHQTLTNAFVNLFEEAHRFGVQSLLSCFVGCGQGGGTGKELARAIHDARNEFFDSRGVKAPNITLVGMDTPRDRLIRGNFISEWEALGKPSALPGTAPKKPPALTDTAPDTDVPPQKRQRTPAPTPASFDTCTHSQVLIPGLLDINMHPNGGMFGAARELAKKGEQFALVNAANEDMQHIGGIAYQFSQDLGTQFDRDTQAQRTQTGHCLTVGAYDYAVDPKHGLLGCQNIHNVVAPRKGQAHYGSQFQEAFVNLLINASNHGNTRIVSCFFGCAIFGGNGTALAKALLAAYRDRRVQSLTKIPQLSLVGWSNSSSDQQVHDDFITTFKQQQRDFPLPTSLNAGPALKNMMGRLQLSEGTETRPEKPADRSGKASTATGDEKMITCGICMESKPEADSQTVNDLPVCPDCTEGYQASGVNLDRMTTLSEEYTAIRYEPLIISKSTQPLPGHPGIGHIVVDISAKAPEKLSNGQKVRICHKEATYYLPDNPVGRELLHLFKVLHKHQLIFKLDRSNTHGLFGITFNFHLKTSPKGSHGYPDPDYPQRALGEITGMASTFKLDKELDVTRLIELIEKS